MSNSDYVTVPKASLSMMAMMIQTGIHAIQRRPGDMERLIEVLKEFEKLAESIRTLADPE